jgi:hypothetical protein
MTQLNLCGKLQLVSKLSVFVYVYKHYIICAIILKHEGVVLLLASFSCILSYET